MLKDLISLYNKDNRGYKVLYKYISPFKEELKELIPQDGELKYKTTFIRKDLTHLFKDRHKEAYEKYKSQLFDLTDLFPLRYLTTELGIRKRAIRTYFNEIEYMNNRFYDIIYEHLYIFFKEALSNPTNIITCIETEDLKELNLNEIKYFILNDEDTLVCY